MKRPMVVCLGLALLVAVAPGMTRFAGVWMGRQPDGSFLVSTGQRIEAGSIAFTGRPIDLALHPTKDLFAVLNKNSVFLATAEGVIQGTEVGARLRAQGSAGWSGLPTASGCSPAPSTGTSRLFRLSGTRLLPGSQDHHHAARANRPTRCPGGMAITRDGSRLFVAAANRNAVVEVDLAPQGAGAGVPGREPALRAAALGRRVDPDRQQLGRPAAPTRRPNGQEPEPRHRGR